MSKISTTSKKLLISISLFPNALVYLITNLWTWPLLIIPAIINVILTIFFWIFLKSKLDALFSWIILKVEFLEYIHFVFSIFSGVLAFFVAIYLILTIGMIVNSPFYGKLAEQILVRNNLPELNKVDLISMIMREIVRSIKFQVLKLFVSILVLIITSVLNLIPLIGQALYLTVNFLFIGYINVLDFYDPTLGLRNYRPMRKFKFLWKYFIENIGLISLTSLVINIPFINMMFVPIAVTSGALFYVKTKKSSNS